jgi:hypothetical protein
VYTFLVAPDANKIEIKQAIEAIFSVKVTNVNTVNRKGAQAEPPHGRLGQAVRPAPGDRRSPRRLHRDLRGLMPIRKHKPTSPGRRFQTVSDFAGSPKTSQRNRSRSRRSGPRVAACTAA